MLKQLYRFQHQLTFLLIASLSIILTGCGKVITCNHFISQVYKSEHSDDYTLPKHKLNTVNAVHFKKLRAYALEYVDTDKDNVTNLYRIFYPDGRVKTFTTEKGGLRAEGSGGFYKIENGLVKSSMYHFSGLCYYNCYIDYRILASNKYLIPRLNKKLNEGPPSDAIRYLLKEVDASAFFKEDVVIKGSWTARE